MKLKFIQQAQRIIRTDDDGDFGKDSITAAQKYTLWEARHPKPKGAMTADRWVALVIQVAANKAIAVPHPVAEDAWWGQVTEDAAYRLLGEVFVRPDENLATPATPRCRNPTEAQMMKRFGAVGSNQVIATLPFPMRLDWDLKTSVTRLSCHKDFQAPLTAALEEMRDDYGIEKLRELNIDRTGGVLNVRKKRGGSTWSSHAWGTAKDFWPSGNKLAWKKDRAAFSKPEYAPMRKALAKAGLMSLGECSDFDWMHWQLNP